MFLVCKDRATQDRIHAVLRAYADACAGKIDVPEIARSEDGCVVSYESENDRMFHFERRLLPLIDSGRVVEELDDAFWNTDLFRLLEEGKIADYEAWLKDFCKRNGVVLEWWGIYDSSVSAVQHVVVTPVDCHDRELPLFCMGEGDRGYQEELAKYEKEKAEFYAAEGEYGTCTVVPRLLSIDKEVRNAI